jgi:hypothetical protein
MSNIVIIDTDYATLIYHPESKIIHHTFHRPISGKPFRDVLMAGANLLKQHHGTKWLSDDRKNLTTPEEDAHWAMTEWSQMVMDAGWKYWAIIVPDAIEGRINMKEFIDDNFEKGVQIALFDTVEEAMAWLESRP